MQMSLLGPYELSYDTVAAALPYPTCGVFALGHVDAAGTFRVLRVGRDEKNLRQSLNGMIGSSTRFKYALTTTPQQAFEAECELFHRFRPPGNIIHPDRPQGSDWRCPVCLGHHR